MENKHYLSLHSCILHSVIGMVFCIYLYIFLYYRTTSMVSRHIRPRPVRAQNILAVMTKCP